MNVYHSFTHSLSFIGIHDGSKCADKGSDCCASVLWGEKPACKDGYTHAHYHRLPNASHSPSL